ncbi:unnamed protein product, partial [Meganyctiphanes norvegica]
ATRLLSNSGDGHLNFVEGKYCATLPEDAPLGTTVVQVSATHSKGARIRYSITGGNRDGIFTVDQRKGLIILAAHLDYESHFTHELVVTCEVRGDNQHSISPEINHAIVAVTVTDVNDNPPEFTSTLSTITVIEEDLRDLPELLIKVSATDVDTVDSGRLHYSVVGDGMDGLSDHDKHFEIHPITGELFQIRALDRDPPVGKAMWRLTIQVYDGQNPGDIQTSSEQETQTNYDIRPNRSRRKRSRSDNDQNIHKQFMNRRTKELKEDQGENISYIKKEFSFIMPQVEFMNKNFIQQDKDKLTRETFSQSHQVIMKRHRRGYRKLRKRRIESSQWTQILQVVVVQ